MNYLLAIFVRIMHSRNHSIIFEGLRDIGFNGRIVCIVTNLYWKETASISVNGIVSQDLNIKISESQGCILSF